MGMYNEVYKNCPACGKQAEAQIAQLVPGFGEFDLDRPESLAAKLSEAQLLALYEAVRRQIFYCEQCNAGFTIDQTRRDREALAKQLFA